jgi:hypothetical protein
MNNTCNSDLILNCRRGDSDRGSEDRSLLLLDHFNKCGSQNRNTKKTERDKSTGNALKIKFSFFFFLEDSRFTLLFVIRGRWIWLQIDVTAIVQSSDWPVNIQNRFKIKNYVFYQYCSIKSIISLQRFSFQTFRVFSIETKYSRELLVLEPRGHCQMDKN